MSNRPIHQIIEGRKLITAAPDMLVSDAAKLMRREQIGAVIVVSDGYHIYRVKAMLVSIGLEVYGSPRRERNNALHDWWNYFRQAVGYMLWRTGVPV